MPDDRLEREIKEILDKVKRFPEPESRRTRIRKRFVRDLTSGIAARQQAVMRQLSRISIGQVMLLSFLLIFVSFFFRRAGPLGTWALVAGVVLFVSSFAIMVLSGGDGTPSGRSQYWRGRELGSRSPPIVQRVRRWFASRRPRK